MSQKIDLDSLITKVSELGRLQAVDRKITRFGSDRWESTAEHSWHLAMAAWLFLPYYEEKLDKAKVVELALLHDVVEIYAGDTFAYDTEHKKTKHDREGKAIEQLFPAELGADMKTLWWEYALRKSPEARYVAGLDKLVPMIRHVEHDTVPEWKGTVDEAEIRRYKEPQLNHSSFFMQLFEQLLDKMREKGYI